MLGYTVNWKCFLLLIALLSCGPSRVESINTYAFEEWCGQTVSQHRSAGKLLFTATKFATIQWDAPKFCNLTLTPAPLTNGANGKILFYFTQFDLPGTCDDVNVTLLDGASADAPKVLGAPFPLCGNNHTLTNGPGVMFNTTGESLTVELRWTYSDIYALAWSGFALNYGAYYEGVCGDDVIRCQNGRCTSKQYHCHSEIDTCGGGEERACVTKTEKKPELGTISDALSNIMSGIEDNAMYIGAGFALLLLAHFFGVVRRKSRVHGSVRNFLRYTCCGGSRNSQDSMRYYNTSVHHRNHFIKMQRRKNRKGARWSETLTTSTSNAIAVPGSRIEI